MMSRPAQARPVFRSINPRSWLLNTNVAFQLRTAPPFASTHAFCASQDSPSGSPQFSFWISIVLSQDLLFAHSHKTRKNAPALVGTVQFGVQIRMESALRSTFKAIREDLLMVTCDQLLLDKSFPRERKTT